MELPRSCNQPVNPPSAQPPPRTASVVAFTFLSTFLICHGIYLREHGLIQKISIIPFLTAQSIEETVTRTLQMDLLPLDLNISSKLSNDFTLPTIESSQFSRQLKTTYEQIMMDSTEINLVLRHLDNVENYLEWGSGGSTLNFARFVTKKAISIEHNKKWCQKMKESIKQDSELSHVDYHCVPVARGEKGWGYFSGFEEGTYHQFKGYVDEIDQTGVQSFDMILVDGRARVSASIKALSYLRNDSLMVLHDAERINDKYRRRYGYGNILKYYDIVESVGRNGAQGLAILRRKPKMAYLEGNHAEVQRLL